MRPVIAIAATANKSQKRDRASKRRLPPTPPAITKRIRQRFNATIPPAIPMEKMKPVKVWRNAWISEVRN